jgi:hypothetical protein
MPWVTSAGMSYVQEQNSFKCGGSVFIIIIIVAVVDNNTEIAKDDESILV